MGDAMASMDDNMGSMGTDMRAMAGYMRNMGADGGYMQTMSNDMADMRVYMLLMAGDPDQVEAYREAQAQLTQQKNAMGVELPQTHGDEMEAIHESCSKFLESIGKTGTASPDDAAPEKRRHESYMASMRRDMSEMDTHILCMYLSMSADMRAMRTSIGVMTPSVANPLRYAVAHAAHEGIERQQVPIHTLHFVLFGTLWLQTGAGRCFGAAGLSVLPWAAESRSLSLTGPKGPRAACSQVSGGG